MRLVIVLCCLALIMADDFADIEVLLSRGRMYVKDDTHWASMHKCLVDQGPCNEQEQASKDTMDKISASNCGICTPKQREELLNIRNQLSAKHSQNYEEYIKYKKLQPGAFFARG